MAAFHSLRTVESREFDAWGEALLPNRLFGACFVTARSGGRIHEARSWSRGFPVGGDRGANRGSRILRGRRSDPPGRALLLFGGEGVRTGKVRRPRSRHKRNL